MDLEDKKVTLKGFGDKSLDLKKIATLGKAMAIFGAGTLALICIALVTSGAITRIF